MERTRTRPIWRLTVLGIVVVAVLAFAPAAFAQQQTAVDLTHPVYRIIETAELRGVLSPQGVADTVSELWRDTPRREKLRAELLELTRERGAARMIAEAVCENFISDQRLRWRTGPELALPVNFDGWRRSIRWSPFRWFPGATTFSSRDSKRYGKALFRRARASAARK